MVYNELIRLNLDKAVPPTQRLTFLGVEIDTVNRQLSLPDSKLCELRELLSVSMAKQSITKWALQTLVGKLNFAAQVAFGGRTFLWRMIDTVNSLQRPHHHKAGWIFGHFLWNMFLCRIWIGWFGWILYGHVPARCRRISAWRLVLLQLGSRLPWLPCASWC